MGLLLFSTLLLPDVDKGKSCEDEYNGERDNPADGSRPTNAVDVEEEIGKPLICGDIMPYIDEGNIEVG